jgi:glycerol-3-phosphate dehydrogenase (NAD(P)+)
VVRADLAEPIAVLGAGSWGTALAVHLARSGHRVRLWARSTELCRELEAGSNPRYLPGVELPKTIQPTSRLADCAGSSTVLMVVPSHGFRQVLRDFLATGGAHDRPLVIVSGTKGIEVEHVTRMSGVCFEEGIAADRDIRFAVLSGPSFAEELMRGTPTAAVIASEDTDLAHQLRDLFSSSNFRLYSSSDVAGVEIAGTAKNVVAIAAGAAFGLGFGHNTLAALMTRGLHEIARLGIACGGRQRTFSGLAGMGDLVLTCTGGPSRNRQTGLRLAEGKTLEEIRSETSMVAEGVLNSLALSRLAASKSVEMPITEKMVEVLYQGKSPRRAVEELMSRDLKAETEM